MKQHTRWLWRMGLPALGFLCGCQLLQDQSKPQLPRFETRVPVPVAIQVIDERPAVERGEERSTRWIYYTLNPEAHSVQMAGYLGNAISAMGACPSYAVLGPDVPPNAVSHLLQIRMIHATARWPVKPNQNHDTIPVQGFTELRLTLYLNGERVYSTTLKHQQPDFRVPVRIIKPGMARKVVGDALIHQYEQTMKDSLESVLYKLEKPWPVFSEDKPVPDEVQGRLTPHRRM